MSSNNTIAPLQTIATLQSKYCSWNIGENGIYTTRDEEEGVEYSVYWETRGYTAMRNGDVLGFDLSFDQADQACATDFSLAKKFKEDMEAVNQLAG